MYPTDIRAYTGGDICTLFCDCSVGHNNTALGKPPCQSLGLAVKLKKNKEDVYERT